MWLLFEKSPIFVTNIIDFFSKKSDFRIIVFEQKSVFWNSVHFYWSSPRVLLSGPSVMIFKSVNFRLRTSKYRCWPVFRPKYRKKCSITDTQTYDVINWYHPSSQYNRPTSEMNWTVSDNAQTLKIRQIQRRIHFYYNSRCLKVTQKVSHIFVYILNYCLHFQVFVYILNFLSTFSAFCLYFQLFVYILNFCLYLNFCLF